MIPPIVVFAVGNPSRGDDAIGPELCGRLEGWLANEGLSGQFELIEDFQLQIEHALDLQGRQLALFIDAGANTPGPFTFQRIAPATGAAYTTHELPPGSGAAGFCADRKMPNRHRLLCFACVVSSSSWESRSAPRPRNTLRLPWRSWRNSAAIPRLPRGRRTCLQSTPELGISCRPACPPGGFQRGAAGVFYADRAVRISNEYF